MDLGWGSGNDRQTINFAFAIKTRDKSVSREVVHKLRMQERGEGSLTKSVYLFFWWHHSFVKLRTRGEWRWGGGGQIFRLFKGTYFMDGPRDNDKSHKQKSKNYFRSMI